MSTFVSTCHDLLINNETEWTQRDAPISEWTFGETSITCSVVLIETTVCECLGHAQYVFYSHLCSPNNVSKL